jgi:excisionase family DNA binding protein
MGKTAQLAKDVQELARRACERVQRASQIPPRLLDIDDAARYLSVSDKAIRELITQGQLAYVQKIAGRSPYLVDIRDLDRWIEKSKIRAGE